MNLFWDKSEKQYSNHWQTVLGSGRQPPVRRELVTGPYTFPD